MNDQPTTQKSPAPIVLKLKKLDDHHSTIAIPHSCESIGGGTLLSPSPSSSFIRNNEISSITSTSSPSTLRVKFKKSFVNGNNDHNEEESPNSISSENVTRPAKRSRKSSLNDSINNVVLNSDFQCDQMSSQHEKQINEINQDYVAENEQTPSTSLVLKIRRNSLTPMSTTSTNSSTGVSPINDTDTNRQILVKFKKTEYDGLMTNQNSSDLTISTAYPVNNGQTSSSTLDDILSTNHSEIVHINAYTDTMNEPSSSTSHVTNVLSNLNNDNNDSISQETTSKCLINQKNETHTKELLDEALDSVKNVLMLTFKKNLESGGDLNALKTTLSSDEVAEVFLAKLRQSLKRDADNESKSQEINVSMDTCSSLTSIVSSSSNEIISPVTNVISSPSPSSSSSSPLLPPMSSLINRNCTTSVMIPSVTTATTTQSHIPTPNTNKRKSSSVSTNPNRFDGATEEELSKRLLSDILQPNLDIVFVGINPSLYAVHKGHHYGGPGNHFWKLLHMSGLIPNALTANDDYRMPQYGIGFTNIVQRPSKAGSDITKDEITAGAEALVQKIKMYRPKIVAFNGRGIYEVYAGNKHFHYGKQPELFPETDTHVFVMPSSSARCSQLPRAEDKLPFYVGLRKLRDFVNGTLHSLNETEITFPDIKIKDTDDVLQKTVIRISNKPFSELSADVLKSYGDKIPSGQLISKYVSSSSQQINCSALSPTSPLSSSNLVFNTDALTTQTMSILHNTAQQQNESLLNYDQPTQRPHYHNDDQHTSVTSQYINQQQQSTPSSIVSLLKNSIFDNSSSKTNGTIVAALTNGGCNSSISSQPTQTMCTGGQQSISYSNLTSSNNKSTAINSCSLVTSSSVNHRQISNEKRNLSSTWTPQVDFRQITVPDSTESLPSIDTLINSSSNNVRTQPTPSKDSISSHQPIQRQALIVVAPQMKSLSLQQQNSSTLVIHKTSNTNILEKYSNKSSDDCLYARYERESNSVNQDQFRFSYVIDEHSPSSQKTLRYVSINDL